MAAILIAESGANKKKRRALAAILVTGSRANKKNYIIGGAAPDPSVSNSTEQCHLVEGEGSEQRHLVSRSGTNKRKKKRIKTD